MAEKNYRDFQIDAIGIAEKFHASIDDDQAQSYSKKLFDEYIISETNKDRRKWIEDRLLNEFNFMIIPPKWVGEPRWAYFKGVPMVFLSQFKIAHSDKKMIKKFPIGDTVYIFGSKNPPNPNQGESWEITYRITVQTEEGEDVAFDDDFF